MNEKKSPSNNYCCGVCSHLTHLEIESHCSVGDRASSALNYEFNSEDATLLGSCNLANSSNRRYTYTLISTSLKA